MNNQPDVFFAFFGLARLLRCSVLAIVLSITGNVNASDKPLIEQGIQFGDPSPGRMIVWSQTDRPARMMIDYAFDEKFTEALRVRGPYALESADFTARLDLTGLPAGRDVFVKVWFEDLTHARNKSDPVTGRFRTQGDEESIRLVWGGDTAGQGWGINPEFGGI